MTTMTKNNDNDDGDNYDDSCKKPKNANETQASGLSRQKLCNSCSFCFP